MCDWQFMFIALPAAKPVTGTRARDKAIHAAALPNILHATTPGLPTVALSLSRRKGKVERLPFVIACFCRLVGCDVIEDTVQVPMLYTGATFPMTLAFANREKVEMAIVTPSGQLDDAV